LFKLTPGGKAYFLHTQDIPEVKIIANVEQKTYIPLLKTVLLYATIFLQSRSSKN